MASPATAVPANLGSQGASQAALLVPGRHRRQAAAARWQAMLWRTVAVGVVLALAYAAKLYLFQDGSHPRSRVQRVALISAPKPPPPKPLERPPEVEIQKQEVEVATQPKEAQQPDNQLGVDADGEGAGDGFGLLGKRGGQDITTIGTAGDGTGSGTTGVQRFNFGIYGGMVRQRLQNELMGHVALRERDYVTVVLLWISDRGRIERVDLQRGSGYAEVDSALRQAFAGMPVLPEPPVGLPQPLKIRITSRELHGSH